MLQHQQQQQQQQQQHSTCSAAAVKVNSFPQVIGLLQDLHIEATADVSTELEAFNPYAQKCAQEIIDEQRAGQAQCLDIEVSQ